MSTGAFPPPVPLGNDDLGDEPMREGADGDEEGQATMHGCAG